MTNATTALDRYTGAMEALKAHQEKNQFVFDAHKNLVNNVIDAENDLRDAVAGSKANVSNGSFRVTFTPQTQIWADIEELDRAIFEGKATNELRNRIVKTQERPGRISISEVK